MGGFQNILNSITQGWKSFSNTKKIAVIVLASGIITAFIFFVTNLTKIKYEPLFINTPTEDMAKIVDKFKQDKVVYKLSGSTILVPKDKVEELRLSVMSSGALPSNGKGVEYFEQSAFGRTDTETKILYLRALETELERTIKAYDEIEYARVHLNMPEPSVFVRDEEPASASVTLKLKNNTKISKEQVKGIVALISKSVKNMPEKNVAVIDSNFNYLSQNMDDSDISSQSAMTNRYETQRLFESKIESDLRKMLEAVFGPNKTKVSINADLDFDSKQTSTIKYDTVGIVKNQHTIKESTTGNTPVTSGSPIDNQNSNTINAGGNNAAISKEDVTTNYDVGQVEEKIIKAPGQVRKISTSVVIDGTLSDAVKASVKNIVTSAIGYDQSRGDLISVEGIPFDTSLKKQVETDLKELQSQQKIDERNKKLFMYIGYPLAGILGFILLLIMLSKLKSRGSKSLLAGNVDFVIDQPIAINEIINKQSILDVENEKSDITSELKKYATKRPEQVVDIIKSWLAEDER